MSLAITNVEWVVGSCDSPPHHEACKEQTVHEQVLHSPHSQLDVFGIQTNDDEVQGKEMLSVE